MKSMLNVMSKFFTIGMAFEDIIAHATWIPAQSIHREDLGNLSVGSVADIAVLSILEGQYGFIDAGGSKINGQKKLEAELTLRAGKVVWDLNGLNATLYKF
jgi:dihydroorotase